jgi:DNA polymerase-3 subunit delta
MAEQSKQIFVFHGDNQFDATETLHNWIGVFEKKYSGLNVIDIDFREKGEQADAFQALKNALQVDSLFGSNKLIVLKDLLFKSVEKNKEMIDLIIFRLEKMTPTFFVVFFQTEAPDEKSELYKKLKSMATAGAAEIREFAVPKGAALSNWINSRFQKLGATVASNVAELIVALVGNDLWQIDTEICKLAYYAIGRMVAAEDVRLLVKGKYNDDIFALMDALGRRDKKTVTLLMRDQLDSGANELYLLSMLVRQFRLLRQIKEGVEIGNMTKDAMAREWKIHPFVVQKTMTQIRLFTEDELKVIFAKLMKIEQLMKTQGADFELLFGKLVAEM